MSLPRHPHPPLTEPKPWQWDVFCRVIDNFGDIGVCWRLASQLAARGHAVRLWVDDPRALSWLAEDAGPPVQVLHWTPQTDPPAPGDVVVEAFGCDPPEAFVARMAARTPAPVWINLEYLSAETYVERSHGLRSPQFSGTGAGLDKWFYFPGFTPATGGLLREPGMRSVSPTIDREPLLASLGSAPRPGERCVSVFCYPSPALAQFPSRLADQPTLLLTAPGPATDALRQCALPPGVRQKALPWLSQTRYDRLLQACDLNVVRGEDSFVRAQWAGQPFLWHIYPQADGIHHRKLSAFMDRYLQDAPAVLADSLRPWMRAWNDPNADLPDRLPDLKPWAAHTLLWRDHRMAQADLVTQLLQFVTERR